MKLKLVAAAVMSLSASLGFAQTVTCGTEVTDLTHVNNCAPDAQLFISGSSAMSANVTSIIPDLFDMTKKIYKISDSSTTGASNGNKSATTAWYGTSKSGVFTTQKRLYVVYNNNNGSGAGVSLVMGTIKPGKLVTGNPIESNVIYVGRQLPAKTVANTCAATTASGTALNETINSTAYTYANLVTCANTYDIPADLAISDVRAQEIYKFYSNVPKTVKIANFSQSPLALQGFGLGVNWAMYKALQDAQVTAGTLASICGGTDATDANRILPSCQPNVRSTDYATLVRATGTKTAAIFGLTVSAETPASTKLTLVRRDDASGTQSASNIYFLNNPCNIATTLGGGVPVLDTESSGDNFAMTKKATSSAVRTALDGTATAGYAIGAASLSARAIAANTWNFVKIDGMSPNVSPTGASGSSLASGREAFAKGDYNFAMIAYGIYSSTFNNTTTDKGNLISKSIAAMKDSTRNNVAGIAYIDGAAESTWLKQALVNRVDGNNCAPLVRK